MTWCGCCCRPSGGYYDISEEDEEYGSPNAASERSPLLGEKNSSTTSTGRSNPTEKQVPQNGLIEDSCDASSGDYPDVKVVTSGTTPAEIYGTAPQDWSASQHAEKDFQNENQIAELNYGLRSDYVESPSDASQDSPPRTPVTHDGDDDSLLVICDNTPLYTDYLDASNKITSTPLVNEIGDPPGSPGVLSEDSDFSLPVRPTSAHEAKTYSQTVFLDDTLTDSELGEMPIEHTLSGRSTPEIDASSSTKSPYGSADDQETIDDVWLSCEQNGSNVTLTDNDSTGTLSNEFPVQVTKDLYGQGALIPKEVAGSSVSSSPSELWRSVSTEADSELYTSCSQEPIKT